MLRRNRRILEALCSEIGFVPHPKQQSVLDAFLENKKFIITVAGRRWGKSDTASILVLYALMERDCKIWVVSKTYDLASKVWEYLEVNLRKVLNAQDYTVRGSNGKMEVVTRWGSSLELKSADHEQSLVGSGLDLLVIDEAAFIPKHVWTQRLAPTLIDRGGSAIFISTPEGKNWLYDMYLRGQRGDERYWSISSPSWDNPHLPPEEIQAFRDENDPLSFKQQCGAEFVAFANMVYADFDYNKHVIPERALPGWRVSLSVDPGYAGACAMLWIAHNKVSNEDIVIREVVESRLKNEDVLALIQKYEPAGGYEALVCDVAGRAESQQTGHSFVSWMEEQDWMVFKHLYFHTSGQSISNGITRVRSRLMDADSRTSLWVFNTCPKLIQALENYAYPEDVSGARSEVPVKDGVYDHPADALRYYITWRTAPNVIRNIKAD